MKKTVLLTTSFLVEVDAEIWDQQTGDIDRLQDAIQKRVERLRKFNIKWESASQIILDESRQNCGHCATCGCWCTDKEKENSINELNRGATVDGKLLCDECLPRNHRWAF